MKYMLDTNICIYTIKQKPSSVVERIRRTKLEEICLSTITLSELEYGVAKSKSPERNRLALLEFPTPFRILDFDQPAAVEYGRIRSTSPKSQGLTFSPHSRLSLSYLVQYYRLSFSLNHEPITKHPQNHIPILDSPLVISYN